MAAIAQVNNFTIDRQRHRRLVNRHRRRRGQRRLARNRTNLDRLPAHFRNFSDFQPAQRAITHRQLPVQRNSMQRGVRYPKHRLTSTPINIGRIRPAFRQLRKAHDRRLRRCVHIQRRRLINPQLRPSFNTLFELRNDLGGQLLAHHHRHGLAQGFTRMGNDEGLELGPASRRELDALGHERGSRRRSRREVTLSPRLKLTERRAE